MSADEHRPRLKSFPAVYLPPHRPSSPPSSPPVLPPSSPRIASLISALEGEAAALCAATNRPNLTPISLSVDPTDAPSWAHVQRLVAQTDAVLSLLPATMHVPLAELCIAAGTPLVTASYVSDAMQALHARATQANVPILCEIMRDGVGPSTGWMHASAHHGAPPPPPPHRCEMGLDPGMDHMSAVELIERVHAHGGVVTSFTSNCGGLPSPEVHASAHHGALSPPSPNCGGLPSPEVATTTPPLHASMMQVPTTAPSPLPLPTGGVDYPLRLQVLVVAHRCHRRDSQRRALS